MPSLAQIAYDWGVRCFGQAHMSDLGVRSLRVAEEAVELAQSFNVPKEQILKMVDHIYSRRKGDPIQELGGVLLTSAVIAVALGEDPNDVFVKELRRCLDKSPEAFAKRNQEKLDIGLTG